MEVVSGALPALLRKLSKLLADEYKLQKEAKDGISSLAVELKSMKAALEDISEIPADELPRNDKIWAREVRELSYDIEDNIDTFMVKVKGSEPVNKQGVMKYIGRARGSLTRFKNRRDISRDIKDIKSRVAEVHERRRNYKVDYNHDKPVKIDPRALVRYKDVKELVGIDKARDELIKILIEGNKESRQQDKIVSIVGFGGLGKTTLANVVFEKLRAQFDCSAFISVSRTPDMEKLFKELLYKLSKNTANMNAIEELREFLQKKRYLIIFDDIWDAKDWNTIRCALPMDDDEYRDSLQYRIITTTRIVTVAEQIGGGVYKMKPLCLENSRILMYRRVFGKEYKKNCLDEQLTEVSDRILKKCGGVPLAIITIASLLVTKDMNKLQWDAVYNSIGAGLEDKSIDNMRKVLSLSYYDMPSHLRTCLLYLSMFPEDYEIDKDRLIRLWIAEGFIQCEKKESLFKIGESYLCELINRSMVQAIYDNSNGRVEYCHVHDMVLDLICSLSSEENFVTIWKGEGHSYASEKFRRLSLQNGKVDDHGKSETSMSRKQVRSVVVFPPAVEHLPTLENFEVLRVLDLGDCDISQGYSLKYLQNLLHLRYLRLRNICVDLLHEQIVKLQFLQTLEVCGHKGKISSLPSTIVLLKHLMFLSIRVSELQQEDLEILGGLPALCHLDLTVDHEDLGIHGRFTIGASLFPCLIRCTLQRFGGPVVFQCKAMPMLEELQLEFPVQETREINSGFDLGLGNLVRLQDVHVWFRSGGASKEVVKEAKAAVMHAIEVHPNNPKLRVREYFL